MNRPWLSFFQRRTELDYIDLLKPYFLGQLTGFDKHIPMIASATRNVGARPSVTEFIYPRRLAANCSMSLCSGKPPFFRRTKRIMPFIGCRRQALVEAGRPFLLQIPGMVDAENLSVSCAFGLYI